VASPVPYHRGIGLALVSSPGQELGEALGEA